MEWTVRKGKIEELDRDFDYEFWQQASPLARLSAAWQLVVDYHVGLLEENEDKLRLQRSFITIQRQEG